MSDDSIFSYDLVGEDKIISLFESGGTLAVERTAASRIANNESSEVFDIIKPGRRVKIKGHTQ